MWNAVGGKMTKKCEPKDVITLDKANLTFREPCVIFLCDSAHYGTTDLTGFGA